MKRPTVKETKRLQARVKALRGVLEQEKMDHYRTGDALIAANKKLSEAEASLATYITLNRNSHEAIAKLQRFKDFVHRRLDEAGVEKNPPGPHADAGCRIGQRLELVLAKPTDTDCTLCKMGPPEGADICVLCGAIGPDYKGDVTLTQPA